jgi:hypothetical protein
LDSTVMPGSATAAVVVIVRTSGNAAMVSSFQNVSVTPSIALPGA